MEQENQRTVLKRDRRHGSGLREKLLKKQKSSEREFAAPWLVPSPRYFAKLMLTG